MINPLDWARVPADHYYMIVYRGSYDSDTYLISSKWPICDSDMDSFNEWLEDDDTVINPRVSVRTTPVHYGVQTREEGIRPAGSPLGNFVVDTPIGCMGVVYAMIESLDMLMPDWGCDADNVIGDYGDDSEHHKQKHVAVGLMGGLYGEWTSIQEFQEYWISFYDEDTPLPEVKLNDLVDFFIEYKAPTKPTRRK